MSIPDNVVSMVKAITMDGISVYMGETFDGDLSVWGDIGCAIIKFDELIENLIGTTRFCLGHDVTGHIKNASCLWDGSITLPLTNGQHTRPTCAPSVYTSSSKKTMNIIFSARDASDMITPLGALWISKLDEN